MGWIRTGDCPPERCQGRCCEQVGVWFPTGPEHEEFLQLLTLRDIPLRVFGHRVLAAFDQPCPYLRDGLCSLHPDMNPSADLPERPDFCWRFPEEPSQLVLHPECGFSFQWIEEPQAVSLERLR